jgi:acyl-CoA dehydrogenase
LWSWRDEFGNQRHWSLELGRELIAAGPDGLWPTITAG